MAEGIWHRLTPNNILKTIDNGTVGEISNKLPSKVERNAIFLLDAQNCTLRDISADGLGRFVNNSTSRSDYELCDDGVCTCEKYKGKVNRDSLKTATNVVVKTYYHHKTHRDFKGPGKQGSTGVKSTILANSPCLFTFLHVQI